MICSRLAGAVSPAPRHEAWTALEEWNVERRSAREGEDDDGDAGAGAGAAGGAAGRGGDPPRTTSMPRKGSLYSTQV